MNSKYAKRFSIAVAAVTGFHYLGHFGYDWERKDKIMDKYEKLNEETIENLIDILSEANIKKEKKFKFDFMMNKDALNIESIGRFQGINKLIVLPGYYLIKDENELNDLIQKLNENIKDKNSKLKETNLLKYKDLFDLTADEIRFAILHEIYRTNMDYLFLDTILIGICGVTGINFMCLFNRISEQTRVVLALIIGIIFFIELHKMKPEIIERMATNKLIDSNDLDLLEAGLKYLNKRIQLDQLLGNDVEILKSRFKKIKEASESLRFRGLKSKRDQSNESIKKDAKTLKNRRFPEKSGVLI